MGFVFSCLRQKRSKIDQLAEVWQKVEEQKLAFRRCQNFEERLLAYLTVVYILLYLVAIGLYWRFWPSTSTWLERAAHVFYFVAIPVMVFFLIRTLNYCFHCRRNKSKKELHKMNQEKKNLWEEVKASEPYNVVKQFLEKHAKFVSKGQWMVPKDRDNNFMETANMV